eukprot:10861958-Heterocapsa_arctica.AAC.1
MLLETIKRDGPDNIVDKCRDKMTKHPFPIQNGSGAKNFFEEEWVKLDPLVLRQAGKAPMNISGGFLNYFLNSNTQIFPGDKKADEDDDDDGQNEARVHRGAQSQDEDRNGRRIARNKNRAKRNPEKGSLSPMVLTSRDVPRKGN